MQIDKESMQNRFRVVLAALGRLGDAPGRVRHGLGTPSWAVLAAKLAVLAAKLAIRAAKLAVSSIRLAPLGCLWALVERVASEPFSKQRLKRVFARCWDNCKKPEA